MAKLTKTNLFKATNTKPETQFDKTTRVVRDIVGGAAEERQDKMAALRKARLARDAKGVGSEAVSPKEDTTQ